MVSALDWKYRHSVLFDALEFLHRAYKDKRIDLAKYAEARQGNGRFANPNSNRGSPKASPINFFTSQSHEV